MDRGAWKKPVALEMYGKPGIIRIGDTMDAALLLLGGWHSRRTDAHVAAVLTCRDVLKGKAQPGLARAVFIDAILDAGYHVLPETFLDERWGHSPIIDEDRRYEMPHERLRQDMIRDPRRTKDREAGPRRSSPSFNPDHARIPDLLGRLGETLALIAMEILKGMAGLMNIDLRRRPDRQI